MTTVDEHYTRLLAPIYAWMLGGPEKAFETGARDLESFLPDGSTAVDLGGGFGTHAVPLAKRGWKVLSIDSSPQLTAQLRRYAEGLQIKAVQGDLLDFQRFLEPETEVDLIVCMGDTLTHLPDRESVAQLASRVAGSLAACGRFMAMFRDYTQLPGGPGRFIPVRSDDTRILTCFLEAVPGYVEVHDLLHEKQGEEWKLSVSSYRKLRLAREEVCRYFNEAGLRARILPAPRGMLRLVADR
jgi:SAM-dependent methyltransferase